MFLKRFKDTGFVILYMPTMWMSVTVWGWLVDWLRRCLQFVLVGPSTSLVSCGAFKLRWILKHVTPEDMVLAYPVDNGQHMCCVAHLAKPRHQSADAIFLEDTGEGFWAGLNLNELCFSKKLSAQLVTCVFFLSLSLVGYAFVWSTPLDRVCQWQMSTLFCIWHIWVNNLLSLLSTGSIAAIAWHRDKCRHCSSWRTLCPRTCRHVTVDRRIDCVGFRVEVNVIETFFSVRLLSLSSQVLLTVEEIFVGGEALPLSTCRNWLKKWPHVPGREIVWICHVVILHLCRFLSTLCWVPTCAKSQLRLG